MNVIDTELKRAIGIAQKDVARATAFLPAVMKRATDLALEGGIGLIEGGLSAGALAVKDKFDQLIKETRAIAQDYADEKQWFGDPYKDEREHMRIYAKRNGLDEGFQQLLGVGPGTPGDYDAAYRQKYLK